uniref:Uncharacterized protein n=1 Tax=Brassica oleracea TaxID=3712 RepID=A0A3P6FER0_BRAOL|nr:unnamed protein product [Brassica oleracea]
MGFRTQYNFEPNPKFYYQNPTCTNKILDQTCALRQRRQETMNEGRVDDSTHGNSYFKGVGINIGRGGRHGVVHILVAEEGVDFIDQVEAQELMLEVVHEEVVENNYLRQQCKTLSVVLEIFNDKVYNNFFLVEVLFPVLQIFQNRWVWDYHLRIHLLWGTTPNAQHWGTPPNAQQWGTPPNPQQWGIQSGFQQWETPPNAQRWDTPPTAQQWGAPPISHQWGTPSTAQQWSAPRPAQQWGTPPNDQQWSTPPNAQKWGTPPNAHEWGTPPNVQQWGTQPNVRQWDTLTSAQQWRRQRPNPGNGKSAGMNPTHIQYGFRWTIIMKF